MGGIPLELWGVGQAPEVCPGRSRPGRPPAGRDGVEIAGITVVGPVGDHAGEFKPGLSRDFGSRQEKKKETKAAVHDSPVTESRRASRRQPDVLRRESHVGLTPRRSPLVYSFPGHTKTATSADTPSRASRGCRRPSRGRWCSPSSAGCRRPGRSGSRRRSRARSASPCPGQRSSMSRSMMPLPRWIAPGRWSLAHSLSSRTSTSVNLLAAIEHRLDLVHRGFPDPAFRVVHNLEKAWGMLRCHRFLPSYNQVTPMRPSKRTPSTNNVTAVYNQSRGARRRISRRRREPPVWR